MVVGHESWVMSRGPVSASLTQDSRLKTLDYRLSTLDYRLSTPDYYGVNTSCFGSTFKIQRPVLMSGT